MTIRRVVKLKVADHVSPLLKAISDAGLTVASAETISSFPPDCIRLKEVRTKDGSIVLEMRPTLELIAWLYHVLAASEQEA